METGWLAGPPPWGMECPPPQASPLPPSQKRGGNPVGRESYSHKAKFLHHFDPRLWGH